MGGKLTLLVLPSGVPKKQLPFWIAYARAVLLFFTVLMVGDGLAYLLFERWIEWWGMLALAAILPGLGLMITWD